MRAAGPCGLAAAALLAGCASPGLEWGEPACAFARESPAGFLAARVEVDRGSLYCERIGAGRSREGAGAGTPVVLVHGGAHHGIFHPVLQRLGEERAVVFYDQRGFGWTEVDGDAPPTTLARDVADLEALRVALEADSVDLLALSNGGPIAIDYALTHSSRVRRLVLLDTYADNPARIGLATPLVEEVLAARDRDLLGSVEGFLRLPHSHHERPLPEDWVRRWFEAGVLGEPRGDRAHRSPGERSGYARLDDLAQLEAETLVICGARDRVTPLEHARAMAAQLPHGRLHVIADAGHLAFAEAPEEFLEVVAAFLAR